MNEFLALMLKIVTSWSVDRNPEKSKDKPIYKEPPLTLDELNLTKTTGS
jgi:hypothetical protein